LKKKVIKFLSLMVALLLMIPCTSVNARVVGASISGPTSLKAGNTYNYSASFTSTEGTKIKKYVWSISGGKGVSMSSSGNKCTLRLNNSASGGGVLRVTAQGADGSSASREIGFNITPQSTKPSTTKRSTTKQSTTKKATTTKQSTTKKPTTTKRPNTTKRVTTTTPGTTKSYNPNETLPSTTEEGTSEEDTSEKVPDTDIEEPTTVPETTQHPENVDPGVVPTTLELKVSVSETNEMLFEWNECDAEFYNLYVSADGENFSLIYSGTNTYYRASKLKRNTQYKVVVEALNTVNGEASASDRSEEKEFSTPKLTLIEKIKNFFK